MIVKRRAGSVKLPALFLGLFNLKLHHSNAPPSRTDFIHNCDKFDPTGSRSTRGLSPSVELVGGDPMIMVGVHPMACPGSEVHK